MNYRHFKYEGWLYGLAFLLALGLRLAGLGVLSLTDAEAGPALQALQIAQGLKPALGPHPAYILFTTPLFFLYGGGTNFLARLIPALVGSSLVFAPLLFTDRIKPRPSLLLAFFIALDPGLTAISRHAASPIFALTFLVFAWGFWNQNKPRPFAFFSALALLGGPAVWAGLLGIGVTWAIRYGIEYRSAKHAGETGRAEAVQSLTLNVEAVIAFGVTFIVAGSLFFIVPNGLSAALSSIPAYLSGWISPSNFRAGWQLISLLVYQPFALLLGLIAIMRGWIHGSRRIIPLSIWFFVALLLAVFYPARQIDGLVWSLIPLWGMGALELARYLDVRPDERKEAVGAILLTIFLWVFGWLNFASLAWLSPGQAGYSLRLWLVLGSFMLLALSLLLVAFGWSIRIAQLGAIWGLGVGLGLLGLAGTIGSTGLRGMLKPELWWPPSIPAQADLLNATIDQLSEWDKGYDNAIPVIIYGLDSPALEWALRDHRPEVVKALDITSAPELVVTNFEGDPGLAASYRGQDFTWRLVTSWEIAQPGDWLRWLAYREWTQTGENIILWAREDLFLDSSVRTAP